MSHKVTYEGLHAWFKGLFEHLGWMVLAKADGRYDKVKVYKKSIEHLLMALEEKQKTISNADKKADLHIMHAKVQQLRSFAKKL